jgi:MYXO-CTERM domain-containing protein
VTFNGIDVTPPSVTIDQDGAQADPTAASPIHFAVVFSEAVTGFAGGDVTLGGTAGATTAVVTGGPITYDVAVSGMTANGTVTASLNAGAAIDGASNPSLASTSTDNTVTFNGIDVTPPSVTIDQDGAQADPTAASPIHFTVVFSEAVTGFGASDVALSGTAGATTAVVTGGPTTYDVAVSGMTTNGTVTASINAGAAIDGASNQSTASTSTDNTVIFNGIDAPDHCVGGASDCPSASGCGCSSAPDASGFGLFALVVGGVLVPWRRRRLVNRRAA